MTQPLNWDNLLYALESDPNLREALRRHVLTDEVLNMPATVANLTKHVETIALAVGQLQTDMTAVKQDIGQLQTDMTAVRGDLKEVRTDMTAVKEGLGEVRRTQNIQSGVFSEAAGAAYENTAIRLAPRLFRRHLGLTEAVLFGHYPVDQYRKLKAMAEIELSRQGVTSEEVEDLLETDMVFTAKGPNGDVFIVTEASLTVQSNDVIRASRRSRILDRITGPGDANPPTVAVVMGKAISEDAQALLIEQSGETGMVTFLMANADAPED